MKNIKQISILLLLLSISIIVSFGCNTTPVTGVTPDFRVEAMIVIDTNKTISSERVVVAVRFMKNGVTADTSQIMFADSLMIFNDSTLNFDSIFSIQDSNVLAYTNTNQNLSLHYGNDFDDTVLIAIPDSFTIGVIADPLIQNNIPIQIDWNGSTKAEAYVIAAVKSNEAYTGVGWSSFNETQVPSGVIPPAEAFVDATGLSRDTGLYNIYIYAITGSMTVDIADNFLPVPLPGQYIDNVMTNELVGRVGSIFVTLLDTVRVVEQP